MTVLTIECEACRRHTWSVHVPRDLTMTPDEMARERTSEDTEVEHERAAAQGLGYGFADGRKDLILRCPICGTPSRWMPK
jgi:hypothetical protein